MNNIVRICFSVAASALLALLVGCGTPAAPKLPSPEPEAVVDQLRGPAGQAFLGEIVSHPWPDDGQRVAELFSWIPRDAHSQNRTDATRAGEGASAIAAFLADASAPNTDFPSNNVLRQCLSTSLITYLGAMVGDDDGTSGFNPLDQVQGPMPRTAALFTNIAQFSDVSRDFTVAAATRASSYEEQFAKEAVSSPTLAGSFDQQEHLWQAARLRGLLAIEKHRSEPGSPTPTPSHAMTQVAYDVAALTVRRGNPRVAPRFVDAATGQLLPPAEVPKSDWSDYDAQLSNYLSDHPPITRAIRTFGNVYDNIAGQK